MERRKNGFTLVEAVIVVALIGIIASLFVPQVLNAVQKAKQKGTMGNMFTVANAILDRITDEGAVPEHSGPLAAGSPLYTTLCPLYLKTIPLADQWGSPFYVYCGAEAVSGAGIEGLRSTGHDDFLLISYGSDRRPTPFTFDPTSPGSVYFAITNLRSFGEDLVIWNGTWIHICRSALIED